MSTPDDFDAVFNDAARRQQRALDSADDAMTDYSKGVAEFGKLVEEHGAKRAADAAANWITVPTDEPGNDNVLELTQVVPPDEKEAA